MNGMVSRENMVIIKMTKHIEECSPEARIHTYTHMKSQKDETHTHTLRGTFFKCFL